MLLFRHFILEEEVRSHHRLTEAIDPKDTLRKLLNLAKRPGTIGEGEAAQRQAENLAKRYGIDLNKFDATEPPPVSTKPRPAAAVPPKPPVDPFQSVLGRFGWRKDFNPFYSGASYTHRSSDLAGHRIDIGPDQWSHTIHGNTRYGGKTINDLINHLRFNVH